MPGWRGQQGWGVPAVLAAVTTFDPVNKGTGLVLSNGNLTAASDGTNGSDYLLARSTTSKASGKYCFGLTINASARVGPIGICNASQLLNGPSYLDSLGWNATSVGWLADQRVIFNSNTVANVNTWSAGDVLLFAIDISAKLVWTKNNSNPWNNDASANPATGMNGLSVAGLTSGPFFAAINCRGTADSFTVNFAPSGAPAGFGSW